MSINFSNEFKEQVKEENPLFEVASEYVTFEETGSVYQAVCPIHDDNDPSFKYHKDSQQISCYGCGRNFGDSIEFIMEVENLEFKESVKFLADRVGIELPSKSKKQKKLDKFRAYLQNKTKKFWNLLTKTSKGKKVAKYLIKDRKIPKELLLKWRIGYCDFSEKDNKRFRKFCNRIVFPIRDRYGRVIGFSGRQLPDDEGNGYPKYINSSDNDNPLFIKKKVIYGLYNAKSEIRKQNQAILVEGFTDVVKLDKYGINNAVATMGTAITEQQVELLKKYTDNVILFLDGDSSGQEAMKRSIKIFKQFDVNIELVKGESGKDPAEMVEDKKYKLEEWITNNSKTIEQYYIDDYLEKYNSQVNKAKKELLNNLSETFDGEFDKLEKEIALGSVCEQLNISMELLKEQIGN